jgi:hypothetical protein
MSEEKQKDPQIEELEKEVQKSDELGDGPDEEQNEVHRNEQDKDVTVPEEGVPSPSVR